MNMNATAQMVTTTQVGCGKNHKPHRFIIRDHTVFDTKADAFIGLGDVCYLLNEADVSIPYPLPCGRTK